MPNETVIFVDPGDTVVVRARTKSSMAPFDESAHQEGLDRYRRFLQVHSKQIGHLLGGEEPDDAIKLLMDAEREIPNIPRTLIQSGMTIPEIISMTAIEFRPSEVAGDMSEAVVRLLFNEVAQGIPKKHG